MHRSIMAARCLAQDTMPDITTLFRVFRARGGLYLTPSLGADDSLERTPLQSLNSFHTLS